MKLTICFKSPDSCDNAIEQALDDMEFADKYEREDKKLELEKSVARWIELDTETGEKRCL